MPDQRFHHRAGPFTIADILAITGAVLADGVTVGDRYYVDVASLDKATADTVSFLDNRKYAAQFRETKAGACLVSPDFADQTPAGTVALICAKPYRAYAKLAQAFYPQPASDGIIHPTALIDGTAKLGRHVSVGPYAVIGANVKIGDNTQIGAHVVIGDAVEIGSDSYIANQVSISHALIGKLAKIHPGVRIGQDGFGFDMSAEGHLRVPQLGRVIIEDDVEIGANSTIDRGAGPDTVVGQGSRIDNLVQVAHNVKLGAGVVLVSQSGVAGSTEMGAFSVLAAQAGLAGHLKIGAGAQIGAKAGVMRDVPAGEQVLGAPAVPIKQFFRQVSAIKKLIETPSAKGK